LKRIALLAVIGAGMMALPGSAGAISNCPYGTVYTSGGAGGNAALGVCVDLNTPIDGGYAEVGNGASYGIIDGSDANPAGNGQGYAGFVTPGGVSDSSKDASCDGSDDAAASRNSGGCFWFKPLGLNLTNPVTTMFVCGNTSGPDYATATRDGCAIP
jgi:hypothetical protein